MENEQSPDYLAPRQKKTCDLPEQVSSSSSSSSTTNTTSTTTTTTLIASLAHPGQLFTSISPEFLKKVEVWERLKSGLAVATPPPPPPPFPTESGASGSTAVNAHSKRINDSPEWKDREGSLFIWVFYVFMHSLLHFIYCFISSSWILRGSVGISEMFLLDFRYWFFWNISIRFWIFRLIILQRIRKSYHQRSRRNWLNGKSARPSPVNQTRTWKIYRRSFRWISTANYRSGSASKRRLSTNQPVPALNGNTTSNTNTTKWYFQ